MALREALHSYLVGAAMLAACTSAPMPTPGVTDSCTLPGYTRFDVVFRSHRKLDLAFVIDNSPSMAPKLDKLQRQLPNFFAELRDRDGGSLQGLRVAILDGDLGSGGAITSGPCGPKNGSILGDAGNFQIIDGLACGLTDPAAGWLQTLTLVPANFAGDIVEVFSCLAKGVGTSGCGYQQPLEALGLSATSPGPNSLTEFVREDAVLGLVIISDQDDCSALPNAAMFAPEIATEAPNLRCATRGHRCDRNPLPYPTEGSYTHPLGDCTVRIDEQCSGSTDTSAPTTCTPLESVKTLADEVKHLKSNWEEQLVVAGIFGWPTSESDMATAEYKVAPIPNPESSPGSLAPTTVYDLWPICYDADHLPSDPDPVTGFDAVAAGYGAKPGLRLAAFIDEFGDNGRKLSICQSDWGIAGRWFESATFVETWFACIDEKFVDTDPSTSVVEPDCFAELWEPKSEPAPLPPSCISCDAGPACLQPTDGNEYWRRSSLPLCDDSASVSPCWKLVLNRGVCPLSGLTPTLYRAPSDYKPSLSLLRVQCRVCPDLPPVVNSDPNAPTPMPPGCDY
jgi:hypothetical protein